MAQSLAKVYIHAIFSTHHRQPLILDPWQDELFQVIGGTINGIGCQSLTVGGVADHVHLLFQLGRTIPLADAIGRIKAASSNWVNEKVRPSTRFQWQSGYGAFSVSHSNVESVRAYILRQPEHHAKGSFQEEFRTWLRKYEIEWDERYVWD